LEEGGISSRFDGIEKSSFICKWLNLRTDSSLGDTRVDFYRRQNVSFGKNFLFPEGEEALDPPPHILI
jgi:hypothetical protein